MTGASAYGEKRVEPEDADRPRDRGASTIRQITPDDLAEAIEDGEPWLIVDVREPYEYERVHVPDSVLIPRGLLEGAVEWNSPHRIDALCGARDRPVALLCDRGALRFRGGGAGADGLRGTWSMSLAASKLWASEDLPTASGPYHGPLP
jgi:rhodanese-related sulfurtransferase